MVERAIAFGCESSMPEARHSSRLAKLTGDRLQQPELRLRWSDRDDLEELPCRRAEPRGPREHCIPDRRRKDRLGPGCERLGDEERVSRR